MPPKISEKKQQLMQTWYAEGVSVTEIAKRAKVSYPTAYGYTKAQERGCASPCEYRDYLAQERGFASLTESKEHWAREKGFASLTGYSRQLALERGFESLTELKKHLIQQRGYSSPAEYEEQLAREKGFSSVKEYREDLAHQKGFPSYRKYSHSLEEKRQQRPLNQELSDLITGKLEKLGKTQSWLAEQLGITQGVVSKYASGKVIPRKNLQKRLFEVLELPYQTLDDLVEDIDNH